MADGFYQVPYAVEDDYIAVLKDIIEKEAIDVLIPINDIEIKKVMEQKSELAPCKIMSADSEVLAMVEDKYVCTNAVMDLGITCPEVLQEDDVTIKRIVRDKIGVGSRGIRIVQAGEECGSLRDDQFIQRFVEGEEYTVDVLADWDGKPLYIIPRRRMEVKAGVATKVRIEQNTALIEAVKRITTKFKLPGFSNIQFIKDADKNHYFIEINPRIGGCTSSSMMAAEQMVRVYLDLLKDGLTDKKYLEENLQLVKWNAVITRYYEEMIHLEDS